MRGVAIVSPVRTAVGGFGGSLRSVSAADLASTVIKEVLSRTGLAAEHVDDVILGHGYPRTKATRPSGLYEAGDSLVEIVGARGKAGYVILPFTKNLHHDVASCPQPSIDDDPVGDAVSEQRSFAHR